MSLAIVYSRAKLGIQSPLVRVEVHLANGLPAMSVVGLPETAVKESKDRVRAAILNSGFEFPARRITINLSPADLPKEGGRYDLPIALGILVASRQIDAAYLEEMECLGELALGGELRAVRGILPCALQCRDAGRTLLVPMENRNEALLAADLNVAAGSTLAGLCAQLQTGKLDIQRKADASRQTQNRYPCFSEVRGQVMGRRALEIAAAGQHSLLMIGPPGTGKSMLACRLPGILPPMDEQEALESASVHSISHGGFQAAYWAKRPFRAPHHTASAAALIGGGGQPRPGEVSLAHHGVLFLDELPEFDRRVLEVLREPLESGQITISRAAQQADFPARFQLIAAMNPCPCGHLGDPLKACRCSPEQIRRYRGKISGPLLDRIDLQVEIGRLTHDELAAAAPCEATDNIRPRVEQARARQMQRAACPNSRLDVTQLERDCALTPADQKLLAHAMQQLALSARGYHRILRVARTIADLDDSDTIQTAHLSEAIGYRMLDREG